MSLEMVPNHGTDLKEWLGLALTRFALGGVTVRQVVDAWLESIPKIPSAPAQPYPRYTGPTGFWQQIEIDAAKWRAQELDQEIGWTTKESPPGSGLDLDALESFMTYAISGEDLPVQEIAAIAWIAEIRRIRSAGRVNG